MKRLLIATLAATGLAARGPASARPVRRRPAHRPVPDPRDARDARRDGRYRPPATTARGPVR